MTCRVFPPLSLNFKQPDFIPNKATVADKEKFVKAVVG